MVNVSREMVQRKREVLTLNIQGSDETRRTDTESDGYQDFFVKLTKKIPVSVGSDIFFLFHDPGK